VAYFPGNTSEIDITNFQGSAQAVDPYVLDLAHGLYCQNADFITGPGASPQVQCMTRRGSSQVAQIPNSDGGILSMFKWYFNNAGTQDCYAVYYAPSVGAKAYSQQSASFVALVAVTGAKYLSFATDGIRGYFAFGDASGRYSANSGYIYNAATGNADKLFAPPFASSAVTITISSTGAGNVTIGTHRIGFLYTTRNGYSGPLSPIFGNQFAPSVVTVTSGVYQSFNAAFAFSSVPTWMTPGGTIQVVMSTAANPNEFYAVPGTITSFPSTPGTVTISVSISDGDLAATGNNVTQQQNLLASSISGTPPFYPSAIFAYSSRMCYVTLDAAGFPVVYISDPSNYQSLNAGNNGVYLQGKEIPVHGCSIGQVCYIASLSGLYATSDNGGYPVTWTPPQRVDGSVGVLAPSCLLASAGRILLASEKGLFSYSGGAFPQIPLSYWQAPDWNRINWAAPTQVSIVDDGFDRVDRVIAPLNSLVTNASNTNPIVITTGVKVGAAIQPYPHLIQTGMSVTISGVGGNTAANTTAVATVTGPNTFTIPVAGNGAYTSGGVVTPNSPNAEMSWNYSQGEQAGSLLYSLNAFTAYGQGASATIHNIATDTDEVWYAPAQSNPGGIIRRVLPSDSPIYQDVDLSGSAAATSFLYETGIVPASADESTTLHDYHGAHLRVSGNGNLNLTAYGIDHLRSTVPPASPLAISGAPGLEYLVKWWLRSEQQSLMVGTNAVGAFAILAFLRLYFTNSLPMR
jgi:hypothetical protein